MSSILQQNFLSRILPTEFLQQKSSNRISPAQVFNNLHMMRTSIVPSASSWIPAAPPGSSSAASPPEMMIRPMNSARTLLILFLLTILAIDRTLCLPVQAAQSAIQEQRNQRRGRGWSTRYDSDQLLPSRTSSSSSSSRVDELALSNLLHPVLPAIRRSFQIRGIDLVQLAKPPLLLQV